MSAACIEQLRSLAHIEEDDYPVSYLPADPDGMFTAFYHSPVFHRILLDQYDPHVLGNYREREHAREIASTKLGSEMWEAISNLALRQRLPRGCGVILDPNHVTHFTREHLVPPHQAKDVSSYSLPDSVVVDLQAPRGVEPVRAIGEVTGLPEDKLVGSKLDETYYQRKLRWRDIHAGKAVVADDAPTIFMVRQDAKVPTSQELGGRTTKELDLATEFAALEEHLVCPTRRRRARFATNPPRAIFARMPFTGDHFYNKLVGTDEIQHLLETVEMIGDSAKSRLVNTLDTRNLAMRRTEDVVRKSTSPRVSPTLPGFFALPPSARGF